MALAERRFQVTLVVVQLTGRDGSAAEAGALRVARRGTLTPLRQAFGSGAGTENGNGKGDVSGNGRGGFFGGILKQRLLNDGR